MGSNLTICSKGKKSLDQDTQSLFTPSDEEHLILKFNEISNNSYFIDLEYQMGPFQFTHNYYLQGSQGNYARIPTDFDDVERSKTHSVISPLIGKDSDGTWVYIGECLSATSVKDGRGFMVHLNKQYKFQGYFKEGCRNGRGRLVTLEKAQEGDWINDSITGDGKEIFKDGSVFQGKFANGLYEGLGKFVFADKSSYSGEFSKGERNGYGEYLWNDGSKYLGAWKTGKFSGNGNYIDIHGNIYSGGWKENQMDGYGEYTWKDGKKYRGNYYNGKKHGYGELEFPDGRSWRGNWKLGKMHGKGQFIHNSLETQGLWYEGKFIQS